jgi:hypothetical protein
LQPFPRRPDLYYRQRSLRAITKLRQTWSQGTTATKITLIRQAKVVSRVSASILSARHDDFRKGDAEGDP